MCEPFATEDFFVGAVHAIDYMIAVANDTQGAQVWRSLFIQMRKCLITDAAAKGFNVK